MVFSRISRSWVVMCIWSELRNNGRQQWDRLVSKPMGKRALLELVVSALHESQTCRHISEPYRALSSCSDGLSLMEVDFTRLINF